MKNGELVCIAKDCHSLACRQTTLDPVPEGIERCYSREELKRIKQNYWELIRTRSYF